MAGHARIGFGRRAPSGRPPRGGRPLGVLCLLLALVVALFAVVGFVQTFIAPSGLQPATIVAAGHQSLDLSVRHNDVNVSIPTVRVALQDGTTQTVESTPLYELFERHGGRLLHVTAQVDAADYPKRIEYGGTWYGAGPPVWFWIGLELVLLALVVWLGRAGLRRLRRPRANGLSGQAASVGSS